MYLAAESASRCNPARAQSPQRRQDHFSAVQILPGCTHWVPLKFPFRPRFARTGGTGMTKRLVRHLKPKIRQVFSTESRRAGYSRVCRLRVRTFFVAPAFGFPAFGMRGSGIAVVFFISSIAKAPLTSRKCTARVSFWLTSL